MAAPAEFYVKFWGVRGSIPAPGPNTVRYGGNTLCVEVRCGSERIVIDGGTGLRLLGDDLARSGPVKASMIFTHLHWDHIQGFPFFTPAYTPGNHFDIYSEHRVDTSIVTVLEGQMEYPNFPVTAHSLSATLFFHEVHGGESFNIGEDVRVETCELNHPGGSLGVRVEYKGKSYVHACDMEHSVQFDPAVVRLARDADVFAMDTTYTEEEYAGIGTHPRRGWGHSTWKQAVRLARQAGAARLFLFHHEMNRTDEALDRMGDAARKEFPQAEVAAEGMLVKLI
jgi:phosphoribosyl 1,2-cyclic phosphodiesterase